jgi:hypothetical protein
LRIFEHLYIRLGAFGGGAPFKGGFHLPGAFQGLVCKKGETTMSESGKRDKGKKQPRKKPEHSLKEKRKLKNEKKHKDKFLPV